MGFTKTKNMATVQTLQLEGKTFVVLEVSEYERLRAAAGLSNVGPPLPAADANDRLPAVAFGRASLAQKLVSQRRAAGLSIEQLARRAKVSAKTIKAIESGEKSASVAAVDRIDRVLGKSPNGPGRKEPSAR